MHPDVSNALEMVSSVNFVETNEVAHMTNAITGVIS